MSIFKYCEGIANAIKNHILNAESPAFSQIVERVNKAWKDKPKICALKANRILQGAPTTRYLHESLKPPAIFINPQEAVENPLRTKGRHTWSALYNINLTYFDHDSDDELRAKKLWRYSQALAEFFRHHPTLGGSVQSCLPKGFIYKSLHCENIPCVSDITLRLQVRNQERNTHSPDTR